MVNAVQRDGVTGLFLTDLTSERKFSPTTERHVTVNFISVHDKASVINKILRHHDVWRSANAASSVTVNQLHDQVI